MKNEFHSTIGIKLTENDTLTPHFLLLPFDTLT